jgi:hypothetical protein
MKQDQKRQCFAFGHAMRPQEQAPFAEFSGAGHGHFAHGEKLGLGARAARRKQSEQSEFEPVPPRERHREV